MASTLRNINSPQICDNCGNFLGLPKKALGGNFPGQYYVHCNSCHKWHYTWPVTSIPNIAVSASSLPSSANTSSNASLPFDILPSLPPSMAARRSNCAQDACRKQANNACTFKACRQCCIFKHGGCSALQHSYDSLSTPVKATRPRPSLPGSPTARYLENQAKELEIAAREASIARRLEEEDDARFRETIDRLRQYTPTPAPSPQILSPLNIAIDPSFLPRGLTPPPPSLTLASSTSTAAKRPRRAKAPTTHLNPDWMGAASTSLPPLERARQRFRKEDPTQFQFHVVFWGEDDTSPEVFMVQDGSNWPFWNVKNSMALFGDQATPLEQYVPEKRHWIHIPAETFTVKVKKDEYYFIRRRGVSPQDLDLHVKLYTTPATHLHCNMSGERRSFRMKLKSLQFLELTDDSDDEPVIARASKKHRRLGEEPLPSSPCPSPSLLPPILEESSSSSSVDTLELTTPSSSSATSLSCSSPPVSQACLPTSLTASSARWPRSMHTCDINSGFHAMDAPDLVGRRLEDRFSYVFKKPFVSRTYHRHYACWKAISSAVLSSGVDAGRTPAGLWAPIYSQWALKAAADAE